MNEATQSPQACIVGIPFASSLNIYCFSFLPVTEAHPKGFCPEKWSWTGDLDPSKFNCYHELSQKDSTKVYIKYIYTHRYM